MLALCMCGVRALANYDLPLTEHGPNRERKRETETEGVRDAVLIAITTGAPAAYIQTDRLTHSHSCR